jgi:predicted site-specific integrase-resolvase
MALNAYQAAMLQILPGEEYLTKQEVMQILHISARTLQRRRWDGSIQAFAVNRHFYLYPKSGIEEFITKLQSGELETVTFDRSDQPRPKQMPVKRRARSSRKRKPSQ